MRGFLLAAIAAAMTSACASQPTPVPLLASAEDLSALVGRWAGEYSSAATGRSGSIVFDLKSVGDTAHGDVVMVPHGMNEPLAPADQPVAAAGTRPPSSEVLTISFVRVAGPVVSGTLEPYMDPSCRCRVITTFSGTIRGNVIDGRFTTRGLPDGSEPSGEWRVTRQR